MERKEKLSVSTPDRNIPITQAFFFPGLQMKEKKRGHQ